MRLAVFTNQFPSRISTFFARDMRGLLEAGIEIDIFPIYPLEPCLWRYVPDMLSEQIFSERKVHHLRLVHMLASIMPLPFGKFSIFLHDAAATTASAVRFGIEPLAKNTYALLKGWTWAQQHLNHYDHILAYWGNYAGTCAYIYHRLTGSKLPFSIFLHAGIDLFQNPLYLRQKLLYADNIITCSEFNRQFMKDHFSDIWHTISGKIHIHHHGLDFGKLLYEPYNRSSNMVIAVGLLSMYKGFDYLLRAVYELKCRGIDIEVELIGDGPQANALKALANELGVIERIRFRGWLTFDEVQTLMRRATVLVHPSPYLGDGVPNVIKESMAVGTPVIGSSIAGIPELLDNGKRGMLVPPKDIKALANAIEALVMNDTLRQQYAKRSREYAEKMFDLWQNGQYLAKLLRSTTRKNLVLRNTIRNPY